jgi:hypothetical protein
MTSNANHNIWQDVCNVPNKGVVLCVNFMAEKWRNFTHFRLMRSYMSNKHEICRNCQGKMQRIVKKTTYSYKDH